MVAIPLTSAMLPITKPSTMISIPSLKPQSLTIPVPRLIVYRFVRTTPVSENPPSFCWSSFEGVSNYIVQLTDSEKIVWRENVPATEEPTVTYSSETFLEPGKDYIFTVEIERQYSCVNSLGKTGVNIAEDIKKGIRKIEDTGIPKQLKASTIAQLDGLLIAKEEISNIIQGAIRQGSNSEIICFLDSFLAQFSAFKLLADDCSCDDILDALGNFASQLAAANITLGEYLYLSGIQKSLAESLLSKAVEFAFLARNLEEAFQFSQFANVRASNSCNREFCNRYPIHIRCGGSLVHKCGGCAECRD